MRGAITLEVDGDEHGAVTSVDPEAQRVQELLQRQLEGNASPAETEELALYVQDRPDLRAHIEAQVARGQLGKGWLERVRKDDAIAKLDTTRRTKLERAIGLPLVVGGWALSLVAPTIGAPLAGIGIVLLLYSLVRVRLASHKNDPYKDVVR